MWWLLPGLGAYATWGVANVLDSYLSRKYFKNGMAQYMFDALIMGLAFVPLVGLVKWDFGNPHFYYAVAAGLLWNIGNFPYYIAIRREQPSVVVSLWTFIFVFMPVFAYFMVDERLSLPAYIGMGLIMIGGLVVPLCSTNRLHSFTALLWMLLSSALFALSFVMMKKSMQQMDWLTTAALIRLSGAALMLPALFLPAPRRLVVAQCKALTGRAMALAIFCSAIAVVAGALHTMAVAMADISRVTALGRTQAMFAMLFALLLMKPLGLHEHEFFKRKELTAKLASFAILATGACLVIFA